MAGTNNTTQANIFGILTVDSASRRIQASGARLKWESRKRRTPFMDVVGVHRREVSHSAFLQWLFGEQRLLSLYPSPLYLLLKLLAARITDKTADAYSNLRKLFMASEIEFHNVTVETEDPTQSKTYNDGRADIVIYADCVFKPKYGSSIEKRIRIVIENKIDSTEGKNQCKKYYDHYSAKDAVEDTTTIYVFFAPSFPDTLSDEEHLIKIIYQDILDSILMPLLEYAYGISQEDATYIKLYIDNLTSISNNKGKQPIAMDKELKELLADYYKENEDLILAAIEAAAPDEIKEKVREGQKERDYSCYILSANNTDVSKDINYKSKVAKVFVETYLEQHPGTSFEDMKGIMDGVKKDVLMSSSVQPERAYQIGNDDDWREKYGAKDWYIQSGIWGKNSDYFKNLKKVIEASGMKLTTTKK
jgi:hypothetical protein